jgi:hypothetical protein
MVVACCCSPIELRECHDRVTFLAGSLVELEGCLAGLTATPGAVLVVNVDLLICNKVEGTFKL